MKNKKLILFASSLIGIFLVIVYGFRTSDSVLGLLSSKVINGNRIDLDFRNVPLNDVKVITESEDNRIVIFEKGRQINKIEKNVYGPFRFYIQIKKDLIIHSGHWKTVNWGAHDYSISLNRTKRGYDFTFVADGPNYTKTICSYDEKGRMHGKYRSFFQNGKVEEICKYNHGKLNGTRTLFYENGKIRVSENWHNDTLKVNGKY